MRQADECWLCFLLMLRRASRASDPNSKAPTADLHKAKMDSVSDSWKEKFALMERIKAKKEEMKNNPNLTYKEAIAGARVSFRDRLRADFNFFALLFGPFYYLTKGMWKKAISYTVVTVLMISLFIIILESFGVSNADRANNGGAFGFAIMANRDYYKKIVLGQNGWF